MTDLFEHQQLTIEDVGDLSTDPDQIDTLPTAYAPATITKSQATGLDDPDPTRYEVPISVPIENTGQVTRTNLIPNPSFEVGGSLWGVTAGTGTVTASFGQMWEALGGRAGTNMLQAASDGASAYLTASQSVATAFAVQPGQWVGVNVLVANDGGTVLPLPGAGIRADLRVTDTAGAVVAYVPLGDRINSPFYAGRRIRTAVQMPAGAVAASLRVQLFSGDTGTMLSAGARMWIDAALAVVADTQAEALAQVQTYMDGSTADTQTRWYDWTGAAHASTSEEYAPDLTPLVGAEVNAWVAPRDYAQQVNSTFRGWIESVTREQRTMRRRDGSTFDVWWYQIAATDALGYLSRLRVGDSPWPQENVQQRWDRIVALLPPGMVEASSRADQANVNCAARDVDSVPALELLRDTISIVDGVVLDLGGFGVVGQPRDSFAYAPDDPFSLLHLPAVGFERGEDVLDYDLSINVARVTGKQASGGEVSDNIVTYTNTLARRLYGESAFAISGDGMAPTDGTLADTQAAQRAERLVDVAADPVWRIDGAVTAVPSILAPLIIPGEQYDADLHSLMLEGLGRCIQFEGAPPGRDLFRVIGVRFTYGGARHDALEIEVEPWQMVAPEPYEP